MLFLDDKETNYCEIVIVSMEDKNIECNDLLAYTCKSNILNFSDIIIILHHIT